jgi:pilus assembly protein CpaC
MIQQRRGWDMWRGALIRAAAIGLLLAGAVGAVAQHAHAADPRLAPPPGAEPPPIVPGPESGMQSITLGISKSIVIDLPSDVKDVLVADPSIANAVIRTSRRAYLIGSKVGQTSILFFDAEGRQLAGFNIAVTRDLDGLRAALKRVLPERDIKVEGLGERSVVISGQVATPVESQLAYELAVRFVTAAPTSGSSYTSSSIYSGKSGSGEDSSKSSSSGKASSGPGVGDDSPVLNALTVSGRDQVMLKVTVAEVQRDVIKQLGIDLNGALGGGNAIFNLATENPFTALGQKLSNTALTGIAGGWLGNQDPNLNNASIGRYDYAARFGATLRAMERAGVVRTLAEPNLSAISGESASFLVGGEFPVTAGYTCQPGTNFCQTTVMFKKFGVSLNFTPVVLAEGRISLKVMTEVSELSTEGALIIQGTTIPALKTRRADTTVELPSGGALAMAGMIEEQTKQHINGLPGLLQVPVLGTLFRSRDYINRQTELMVIVTPYVVRPVAPKALSRPDDGFADSSDPSTVLLGRLNRIYGVTGSVDPQRTYFGRYGFILD